VETAVSIKERTTTSAEGREKYFQNRAACRNGGVTPFVKHSSLYEGQSSL
jgi:hypothetical protein